ncbi:UPF0565 protein C2orf69 [Microcaecilia unicolor]|uniref:UPF0565 protein C2orf69-like n=1 Tax=Microcaecilia unicolor TaxID=1415580 RepID=A0A6P7YMU6_9AMPH|nr:UPF0565 protein C2orf69-like [Microcaecilia unicolor]
MYSSWAAALRDALRTACLSLVAFPRNMSLCGGSGVTHPASLPPSPALVRLPPVPGSEPLSTNELLLFLPQPSLSPTRRRPPQSSGHPPQHHVVYFPGDVQNYQNIMACHPENFRWEHWSLENTAAVLARRFPNSYIWVIKSSRMHLHKFSCYDNFVANNMFGAPEHSTDFGAFKHLHALLVNAFSLAENTFSQNIMYGDDEDTEAPSCTLIPTCTTNGCPADKSDYSKLLPISFGSPSLPDSVSFSLVGFSKGCVVLNQLLYELNEAKIDKDINSFITNIKAMYWLDGGHSGGSNTWVTCPRLLKGFAQTGITVHTHVTPYQVQDSMRSWIGKEHKKFVQILTEYGVQVNNQLHFADEPPSLDNHFRVHNVF